MAKKIILKDQTNTELMPITRGELIIDSSGNNAFHSNQFTATPDKAGLMSSGDKSKLDAFENSSEYITQEVLSSTVSEINTRIDNISAGGDIDLSDYATKDDLNSINQQLTAVNTDIDEINSKIDNFDFDVDLTGLVKEDTFNNTVSQLNTKIDENYEKRDKGIPKEDLSNDVQEKLNSVIAMRVINYPDDATEEEKENLKNGELAIALETNTYYKINSLLSKLTITFNKDQNVSLHHCFIEFTTRDEEIEFIYPNNLTWFNGKKPAITEGKKYQISIVNNLGVCANYG